MHLLATSTTTTDKTDSVFVFADFSQLDSVYDDIESSVEIDSIKTQITLRSLAVGLVLDRCECGCRRH